MFKENTKLKRLITSIAVVLAIILIIFIVIKVAFSSQHNVVFKNDGFNFSDAKPAIKTLSNDDNLTLIIDNSNFKLEYSPVEDLLVLTDLKEGQVFRSYPEATEQEAEFLEKNPKAKQILTSPILIGYTQSGLEGGSIHGVNQSEQFGKTKKTINIIDGGLQLVYNVERQDFEIVVEFYLDDDGLEIFIPRKAIKEGHESARLASLKILPYFGAARQEDYGYYVIPDGSGALTRFDANRIASKDSYNKKIYGDDLTFNSLVNPDFKSWPITMPVYGIVKEKTMITSFVKEGDANSSITIDYPGNSNLPFYATAFQFTYRNFYLTKLSKGSKDYELLEDNITIGDVRQKLYIDISSQEDDFTYVDVANKTRDLLLENWLERYGIEKELNSSSKSLNIRFFMGDENKWGGALDTLKVMTTFDDIIEMYEELEEAGVENIRISVAGWQKRGYFANVTKTIRPDRKFGGKSGFKKLTSWASENDIQLSFDNNLLLVYGKPKSTLSQRKALVKKPGVHYLQFMDITNSGIYRNATNYVLSPSFFEKKYMAKMTKNLLSLGAENLDLQQIGDNLYSDYNRYSPLLRIQLADKYVEWLKTYKEDFDTLSIYYGNSYAVSVADCILDIPTVKSANMVFDDAIPFIQIVYHGLIDYYSSPINNTDNMQESILKSLEYGAFFTYELTYMPTGELKYTNYNKLFNSEFALLKTEVEKTYKLSQEVLMPLRAERIVNHFKLEDNKNVYCTEYSNGTKIYVNYGLSGYIIPGTTKTVDSMGYTVITA